MIKKLNIENLLDPSFIDAKSESFLQKAVNAYRKDKEQYSKSVYVIYSTWTIQHTLAIKDINHAKATGLKERLESINSHVRVEIVNEYLSYNNLDALTMCDVIIDCTAKDSVIDVLSKIKTEKIISSISVGFKAERLYFVSNWSYVKI